MVSAMYPVRAPTAEREGGGGGGAERGAPDEAPPPPPPPPPPEAAPMHERRYSIRSLRGMPVKALLALAHSRGLHGIPKGVEKEDLVRYIFETQDVMMRQ